MDLYLIKLDKAIKIYFIVKNIIKKLLINKEW